MSQIVLGESSEQQFFGVTGTTEVLDQSGRILGIFVPSEYTIALSKREPEVDQAELERRFLEEDGRPLADILRDLGAAA